MDLHADHNLPIPHPAFDEFGFLPAHIGALAVC